MAKKKITGAKHAAAKKRSHSGMATKATSAILAAALVSGTTVATALAQDSPKPSSEGDKTLTSANSQAAKAGAAAADKEETVYVKQDANGAAEKTQVSVWLKNTEHYASLVDSTNVTNIENVEGSQTFIDAGGALMWDAQGSDIYYRGDTSQKAPVDVSITYFLDGNEIDPATLAGKSGAVTIRFDYANNSTTTQVVDGRNVEVCTPFVAISGALFDTDKFSNVVAENAKIVSDGDRILVAGVAMPGLRNSLNVQEDEVNIPDYIEIRADTTDFQLDGTLTYVSADFFDDVKEKDFDLSTVQSKLQQMQDGMAQLIDGGNSLQSGLDQLAAGASALDDGMAQLQSQTAEMPNSAAQLNNGAQTLSDKMGEAAAGSGQIAEGAQSLTAGLGMLGRGLEGAIDGIGSADVPGNTLMYATTQLIAGTNAIALGDGTAQNPGLMGLAAGAGELSSGLSQAQGALAEATGQLADGANNVSAAASGASQKAAGAATYLASIDVSGLSEADQAKLAAAISLLSNESGSAADMGAAQLAGAAAQGAAQIASGATDLGSTAASQLDGAIAGANAIQTGASAYNQALTGQVGAGLSQLQAGLEMLKQGDGNTNSGLQGAVTALSEGGQLYEGAKSLEEGSDSLFGGLEQLLAGAKALAQGTSQLNESAPALVSGVAQLKDGSAALSEGMKTAHEGSVALSDGLSAFNDEAVQKIVDAFNGDLQDLTDRVKALVRAGKDYDCFAGKADGANGKVKFIYESAGITSAE